MRSEEQSAGASHTSDETEEPVLVEAHQFSDDDETFGLESEVHEDFGLVEREEPDDDDDKFEEDTDIMSVTLHEVNTLRHLYRLGLLRQHKRNAPCGDHMTC